MSAERVDAHQHFWRLARGDYAWLSPALAPLYRDFEPGELRQLLNQQGIESCIAVQAAPSVAESEFLLSLAGQHAWIRGVVGWVPFGEAQALDCLRRLLQQGPLVGLRPMLQDQTDLSWMLSPQTAPLWEAMQASALCFDALVRPAQLPILRQFQQQWPQLRLVIDHAAKPPIAAGPSAPGFPAWKRDMQALASHGAWVKCSGLLTEAGPRAAVQDLEPFVQVLLDSFGPSKMIWGSDWPVLTLAASYQAWDQMTQELLHDLSGPERDRVLGHNARQFYSLP